ncbi:hypothetical protein [Leptospira stimsonii]|uniref:Uncharacterized protein n=1 Tax=Leptospira stimsonii TaxID=2202203 RepID=A0ABY2N4P7_9LEPT|nr:hypothetical protein [Leptospira stimsonii]TGK12923.1 hypothetical protein EHO98_19255 [Leptospira stimsonii]TGM16910.1 hypothetical protein EHQ90_08390 [Leptospira stimsonii]
MTQRISFKQLEDDLYKLEEILKAADSNLPLSSIIETTLLSASQLLEEYEGRAHSDNTIDVRETFRNLFGFHDIADKLLKVLSHPAFSQLIPHIRLLTKGTVPQNKRAPINDAAANKLFELYVATACMRISQDISLDHPENSKGDNPDIIFKMGSSQIGIACKALQTQTEQALVTNVEKAIDQIEKSSADLGLIFVTLKNVIDHDAFWPILNQVTAGYPREFGTYSTLSDARMRLESFGQKYHDFLKNDPVILQGVIDLFAGKKTPPEVYLFLNDVAMVQDGHLFPVTNLKFLFRITFIKDHRNAETHVAAERINHFIQYGA